MIEQPQRVRNVDVVRGFVMAIMALDHARDYLVAGNPTDLSTATLPLFFTRWITHFCAPTFVLLAGVSARLSEQTHAHAKSTMSSRLAARGMLLIWLDIIVLPVLWWFNFDYTFLPFGVLWAIGWSMLALAIFVYLPRVCTALVGVAIVTLHNLVDGVRFEEGSLLDALWCVIHVPTLIQPMEGFVIIPAYSIVPWVGVMLCGYALGDVFRADSKTRRNMLLGLGSAMIVAFVCLRAINAYGDPAPWSEQRTLGYNVASFLNCTKYPPSLDFLLMTLGPIIICLACIRESPAPWKRPFEILGRTALFFYLVHLPIVHGIGIGLSQMRYGCADWWFRNPPFEGMPEDYGWSLGVLYVAWLLTILGLIPVCGRYHQWKVNRRKQVASNKSAGTR